MNNNSLKVENFFHNYAGTFESLYGHTKNRNFIGRWFDRNLRRVMRLRFEETLKNTANPDIKSILDIGCGPGRYCIEFLKQGKRVVGIDLAEGMLDIAKLATRDIAENNSANCSIEFLQANYLTYEFDEKYDAACLMGFFDYIDDPIAIFNKLKKDITKEIYASFPKDSGLLAKQRRIRYWLRGCPLYLYSLSDLKEIMKRVDLSDKYQVIDCERDYFLKISLDNGLDTFK
jgi:SAM-dependent methyltransferase